MKTATITGTMDLSHGGCNACGPVESLLYSLELDQQTLAIEDFNVSSLVMAIVLHEGWSQEFQVEMIDEFMLYKKGDKEVKLVEAYNQLTYSGTTSLTIVEGPLEKKVVCQKVNQVLSTIFEMEPVNFIS